MRVFILSVLFMGTLAGVFIFLQNYFKSDLKSYSARLVRSLQINQTSEAEVKRPVFIEDCSPEVLEFSNTYFPDIKWENVTHIETYPGAARGGPEGTVVDRAEGPWKSSYQSLYCITILVELTMIDGKKEFGLACLRPVEYDWRFIPEAPEGSRGQSAIPAILQRLKKSHGIED